MIGAGDDIYVLQPMAVMHFKQFLPLAETGLDMFQDPHHRLTGTGVQDDRGLRIQRCGIVVDDDQPGPAPDGMDRHVGGGIDNQRRTDDDTQVAPA